MHYHLEIIMPPTTDIEGAINAILLPFSEHDEDNRHAFYDWYQIGGRYSGDKRLVLIPQETRQAFFDRLTELGVTVSGIQWGKQELSPSNQIPLVDQTWKEFTGRDESCPLFKHANAKTPILAGDICPLSEALHASAFRVIIAGPSYDGKSLQAEYMVEQEVWNGVSHVQTVWDGKISSAIAEYNARLSHSRDEWRESRTPTDDWLTVTVDYHS